MKSLVVIPARLASTRLPGKMLLHATGKTLIQHTYEAASRATLPSGVIVATDHDDIASTVRYFGGRAEMTDPQARSGTDRVAEIARSMPEIDLFVNVQGDEPEIRGESIDYVVELLNANSAASMSTLATPIRSHQQLNDPACVKVVFDGQQRALYFSRSPIPHAREWDDALLESNPPHFFQHLGIYAYRRDFLLQLAALPQSDLEQLEKLEQLRVLHFGHQILVGVIDEPTIGIDTPADYDAFVRRFRNC
jgi:3-deoxy-manno-octulosonate cytidylyltransferase (CMP-KDO synthetase)